MASINKKFQSLPRLIQIILLFIPVVNWLTEVIVRCSAGIHGKGFAQILVLDPEETYFDLRLKKRKSRAMRGIFYCLQNFYATLGMSVQFLSLK